MKDPCPEILAVAHMPNPEAMTSENRHRQDQQGHAGQDHDLAGAPGASILQNLFAFLQSSTVKSWRLPKSLLFTVACAWDAKKRARRRWFRFSSATGWLAPRALGGSNKWNSQFWTLTLL